MKRLFTLWLGLFVLLNVSASFAADEFPVVRERAEKGDADAQTKVGVAYEKGSDGMAKDPVEAVKWFRKAAEQGNAEAQNKLGFAYVQGTGVEKDAFEAVKWFRKAIEQGYAKAQNNLGVAYARGEGERKDPAEAVKWYLKAAEQGYDLAQNNLGMMYARGNGVPTDFEEAMRWFRKAAEQGLASAQYNLGIGYVKGNGVRKDAAEGVKWFRKAADQGNAGAQNDLGVAYDGGTGVRKDFVEAATWYRKAAEQGLGMAQDNLGCMYRDGKGVSKTPGEAVKWYRKSAEQGYAAAQNNLGCMYEKGLGVLKDEIEACAWFNVSAVSGYELATNNRNQCEQRIGSRGTMAAQQRSKELLRQIEANKTGETGGASDPKPVKPDDLRPSASGTGSVISPSGYILTAFHVVKGAKKIEVVTSQGTKTATLVRLDESNDLAVLKFETENFTSLPIAPSRQVRLGQSVATVGFPHIQLQGFSPKVTKGEISSLNGAGDDPRNWQISVPVQAGNSGGPLLDENGNLVGVIISKLGLKAAAATGDLPQNVNYAVKSAYALPLLEPYLGNDAPEPNKPAQKPSFEDMVANVQKAVVLILVY